MALIGDSVYVFNVPGTTDYQGNGRAAGIVVNVSGDGITCNIAVWLDSQDVPVMMRQINTTSSTHNPYYQITRTS